MHVMVTGGAGYIGSHTSIKLIEAGHRVSIVDNFCNAHPMVIDRIEQITGTRPPVSEIDIRDRTALDAFMGSQDFEAVIHFAGLKAVGESVEKPDRYYDYNVTGSLNLAMAMAEHRVNTLVFSSSATVYGDPHSVPIREDFGCGPSNPYGHSKLMVEQVYRDIAAASPGLSLVLLRYFNPAGAHPSGLIGEDPVGIPNNLLPYIAQVAVGRREQLSVWGDDYDTSDGTGVRDYIHVEDLAEGHVAALNTHSGRPGTATYNLGTGRGYSVLEVLRAFEKSCDKTLPYQVCPRREGDIATSYADPGLAARALGWRATRTLQNMTDDAWRWQSANPTGFNEPD